MALALDIGLCSIFLLLSLRSSHQQDPALSLLAAMLSSTYALCLVLAHAYVGHDCLSLSPSLRHHIILVYAAQWLFTLTRARFVFAVASEIPHLEATLLRFAIFTALLLHHALASKRLADPPPGNDAADPPCTPTPEETASLASRLTQSWITNLIWKGRHEALESQHLWELARGEKSATVVSSYSWTTPSTLSLRKRLFCFLKRDILLQGIWAALASVAVFVPAQFLRALIRCLESPDAMHTSAAWLMVVGLLVSALVAGVANTQCEWKGQKINARLRAVLVGEIYAKILRWKGATGGSV
ncbi:hypothetical protein CDD83_8008 [Cordyceps sp. RAO-2017]|nr:hypothetical protein CDD83_8008 [Cordyceps sp. RAO-2017]